MLEGNKVVQGALEEEEKRSFPAKGKAEESMAAAAGAASSPAAILAFLARPLSLLRHVVHGCAGYLGGLAASRLKPAAAAAACQPLQEEGTVEAAAVVTEEEVVVVEVRSRAMAAPQRARGVKEGRGGNGGPHHK